MVDKEFGMAEFTVVIEAHSVAVGAGVVNDDKVAGLDGWEMAVDGEFIDILAEGACNVSDEGEWEVIFTRDGDMVVSVVKSGAHEVSHGSIEAYEGFVGMLNVEDFSDEPACGSGNGAAVFHSEGDVTEVVRYEDIEEFGFECVREGVVIEGGIIGVIIDADTTAEVDETEIDAELEMELNGEVEKEVGGE